MQEVNLENAVRILDNFNPQDALMKDPLLTKLLTEKKWDMCMYLKHLAKLKGKLSSGELMACRCTIFWNKEKRLEFLRCLSDRLLWKPERNTQNNRNEEQQEEQQKEQQKEQEKEKLTRALKKKLNGKKHLIVRGKWTRDIDLDSWSRRRNSPRCNYKGESIVDLLRFIRNKWHHRMELPEPLQIKYAGQHGEEAFYDDFAQHFPDLLVASYAAASQICRGEEWFKKFC